MWYRPSSENRARAPFPGFADADFLHAGVSSGNFNLFYFIFYREIPPRLVVQRPTWRLGQPRVSLPLPVTIPTITPLWPPTGKFQPIFVLFIRGWGWKSGVLITSSLSLFLSGAARVMNFKFVPRRVKCTAWLAYDIRGRLKFIFRRSLFPFQSPDFISSTRKPGNWRGLSFSDFQAPKVGYVLSPPLWC